MPLKISKIIILHNTQYSDSHLIIKGLDQAGQVHSFIARFALKKNSRFIGGVLDPIRYVQVEYQESSKEDGLHKITKASIINSFPKIRKDYDKLRVALDILQIVNKVSSSGIQKEEELFDLLGNTLIELEKTQKIEHLKLFFEARFLYLQGVLPTSLKEKQIFFEYNILNHSKVSILPEEFNELRQEMNLALVDYLN